MKFSEAYSVRKEAIGKFRAILDDDAHANIMHHHLCIGGLKVEGVAICSSCLAP